MSTRWFSEYKVPGGKLVKCDLITSTSGPGAPSMITGVKLHGDFFLHPEDSIEKLEEGLCGLPLDEDRITERARTILQGVQCMGVSDFDFARVIMMAFERGGSHQ